MPIGLKAQIGHATRGQHPPPGRHASVSFCRRPATTQHQPALPRPPLPFCSPSNSLSLSPHAPRRDCVLIWKPTGFQSASRWQNGKPSENTKKPPENHQKPPKSRFRWLREIAFRRKVKSFAHSLVSYAARHHCHRPSSASHTVGFILFFSSTLAHTSCL